VADNKEANFGFEIKSNNKEHSLTKMERSDETNMKNNRVWK
jgi:hypothetical protein